MHKINVGLLCGGRSTEHEVSLQSAKNVIEAIDKEKYTITLIGIDKQGAWHLYNQDDFLINEHDPKKIALKKSDKKLAFELGSQNALVFAHDNEQIEKVDVIFPILHGAYGEDGTVQGLLKLADIPFVGPGILGSAVGMDKDIAKRILRDAGIPIADFLVYQQQDSIDFTYVSEQLGLPLFIKPANAGSSVGVSKVKNKQEFDRAIAEAFTFDNKILIEECIVGREVECAILGNEKPQASTVGEIIATQDFYSYQAKYIDETGAILNIPANIPQEMIVQLQNIALKTYTALCCEGMTRVDMFLTKDNKIIVNEINTIPGFTKISMYPKLWEAGGLSYPALIDRLIELALERHAREQRLTTIL
ncbi:MAG: D-alanine--D-alanine ligase [Pelosinus sp.]|nr:D-alanine--D-alanine ligase [Pelosinus sp.]